MLRDKKVFAPRVYYVLMVTNLLCRFWWLVPMAGVHFSHDGDYSILSDIEFLTFAGMMIEAWRRTQWAVIRVENEFFNNLEQYRSIVTLPPIKDEY